MLIPEQAKNAFQSVFDADSPERYQEAIKRLAEVLADNCFESASECQANWQDSQAGKPWKRFGERWNRFAAKCN